MTTVRIIKHDDGRPQRGRPKEERVLTQAIYFKVEPELKQAFNEACWSRREFAAQVLRKMMLAYVEAGK